MSLTNTDLEERGSGERRDPELLASLVNYIKLLEERIAEYEGLIGKRPFRGKKLNPNEIQRKEFVTPSEAAVLLGGSSDTVKRDCQRLGIEPRRTGGGHWHLSKENLQEIRRYRSDL